jgi:hypothetical protein
MFFVQLLFKHWGHAMIKKGDAFYLWSLYIDIYFMHLMEFKTPNRIDFSSQQKAYLSIICKTHVWISYEDSSIFRPFSLISRKASAFGSQALFCQVKCNANNDFRNSVNTNTVINRFVLRILILFISGDWKCDISIELLLSIWKHMVTNDSWHVTLHLI